MAEGARARARVSALRQRRGAARRAWPGLGRDWAPPVGAAVAACPRDLRSPAGARLGPWWIPVPLPVHPPRACSRRARPTARTRLPVAAAATANGGEKRCREPREPGPRARAPWAGGRAAGGPGLAPARERPGVGRGRLGLRGGQPAPPERRTPGEPPSPAPTELRGRPARGGATVHARDLGDAILSHQGEGREGGGGWPFLRMLEGSSRTLPALGPPPLPASCLTLFPVPGLPSTAWEM